MEPTLEELEEVDRRFRYECHDCNYGPWCQDCPNLWHDLAIRETVEEMWEE
jgi:hypothetical protein